MDVWLIFRCAVCKSTWNMCVYERVDRACLPKEEYAAFLRNDEHLVRLVAFDQALLSRNHVSVDFSSAAVHIDGADPLPGESTDITLYSKYYLNLSACAVVAKKLCISKSRVKKLEEARLLHIDGDVKKRKVGFGFHFTLKEGWALD